LRTAHRVWRGTRLAVAGDRTGKVDCRVHCCRRMVLRSELPTIICRRVA
jgi:hypothetical protein